jgi:hypothetical protein
MILASFHRMASTVRVVFRGGTLDKHRQDIVLAEGENTYRVYLEDKSKDPPRWSELYVKLFPASDSTIAVIEDGHIVMAFVESQPEAERRTQRTRTQRLFRRGRQQD